MSQSFRFNKIFGNRQSSNNDIGDLRFDKSGNMIQDITIKIPQFDSKNNQKPQSSVQRHTIDNIDALVEK